MLPTKSPNLVIALVSLLISFLLAVPTHADGPAVSVINAKIEGFGGIANVENDPDDSVWGGAASLTFPLGEFLGFQIDGLGGEFNENETFAAGAHLFWRDPELALLGATYSYTDLYFIDFERAGVEGEYYLNRLTFKAQVGWQGGRNLIDSAYGGGSASYYFLENLVLQIGAQAGSDHYLGTAQAEWQPAFNMLPGLTVFANGGIGDEDYSHGLFGLRYYFGATKTLIKRHREDDPQPDLNNGIGLNNRQQTKTQQTQNSQTAPPLCQNGELNQAEVCICNPGYIFNIVNNQCELDDRDR
jgi:hypothetical protein